MPVAKLLDLMPTSIHHSFSLFYIVYYLIAVNLENIDCIKFGTTIKHTKQVDYISFAVTAKWRDNKRNAMDFITICFIYFGDINIVCLILVYFDADRQL